jgi:hypothetical protein
MKDMYQEKEGGDKSESYQRASLLFHKQAWVCGKVTPHTRLFDIP